jgi:cobaltochelatase CobS
MNIERQVSLIPLAQLNIALASLGRNTHTDKLAAVTEVTAIISSGFSTLDAVRNAKGTAASAITANASVPQDVRDQIAATTQEVSNAMAQVSAISSTVSDALTRIDNTQRILNNEFSVLGDRLNNQLNSAISTIQSVDYDLINREIRSTVGSLFDQFKTTAAPEVLEKIASSVPATTIAFAGDVFGVDACRYTSNDDVVDFSSMSVELWGDVGAPQLVDDYVFQPAHLHQALIALDDPLPDNVWLAGERGTGKTEFVSQIAARLQRRMYRVNFDEALERADFIGGNTIEQGSVVWKAGIIAQAIQHAGAIVLLDEIGFARAQNLAVLHALCERSPHRSIVISETGERIPVASHVVFFGADNSNGHGDHSGNFAGVRDQNTAFLDRFGFTLRFEYLPAAAETNLIATRTGLPVNAAEVLVKFANVAREKARSGLLTQPPSLRQLFAWSRAVRKGVPVQLAFDNAIINKFPADCEPELRGVFAAAVDVTAFKQSLGG